MIISFKHKGLEVFYTTGSTRGIQPEHERKLRLILNLLDVAENVDEMRFQGAHLHQLKGDLAGHWSVRVNGNWRVTFRFENQHAEVVDYKDYH